MAPPSVPPTSSKKRGIEDLEREREREEDAQIVRGAKRRRIEQDSDRNLDSTQDGLEGQRSEGSATCLIEDNPETWTAEEAENLFNALMKEAKPITEVQLSVQDEQAIQQNMQIVSDWTTGKFKIVEETALAEPDAIQKRAGPPFEEEIEQHSSDDANHSPNADILQRQGPVPGLSIDRPVQPVDSGTCCPYKDVIPVADVLVQAHPSPSESPKFATTQSSQACEQQESYEETYPRSTSQIVGHGPVYIKQAAGLLDVNTLVEQSTSSCDVDPSVLAGQHPSKVQGNTELPLLQGTVSSMQEKIAEALGLPYPAPTSPQYADSPAQSRRSKVSTSVPGRQPSFDQTEVEHSSSDAPAAASTNIFERHREQSASELDRQDLVLDLLVFGSGWDHQSPIEKHQRMEEKWVTKARKYEKDIINKFGVNAAGIDFQSSTRNEILVRQAVLIKRAFVQNHPLPPNKSARDPGEYRERMTSTVWRMQMSLLRCWTAEWELEVSSRELLASDGSLSADRQSPRTASQTSQHENRAKWTRLAAPNHPKLHPYEAAFENSHVRQQDDSMAWRDARGIDLKRTEPSDNGTFDCPPPSRGQGLRNKSPGSAHPHSRSAPPEQSQAQRALPAPQQKLFSPPQSASFARPTYVSTSNPDPRESFINCCPESPRGPLPPPNTNLARTISSPDSSGTVLKTQTKPRGKPRIIMFPNAPRSSTALSARARVDDSEILRSFPEHLSNPEIMRRFVRPIGEKAGGWHTREMVNHLLPHQNSKDYAGIEEGQRRANLLRWVVKERDACNYKIRKELEIDKKTRGTSALADSRNPPSITETSAAPNSRTLSNPGYTQLTPMFIQGAYFSPPRLLNEHDPLNVAAGAYYHGYRTNTSDPPVMFLTAEPPQDGMAQTIENGMQSASIFNLSSHPQQQMMPTSAPTEEDSDWRYVDVFPELRTN